ncbi:MAG: hypothetical protein ACRC6U_02890 [Fusobacteriaceae bacterium]
MGLNFDLAKTNDFVMVEKNINENFRKVDVFADETKTIETSAYGAEWGGYIQDETIKVVGNHYTDKINKKGYVCVKVGSNVNGDEFYKEKNIAREQSCVLLYSDLNTQSGKVALINMSSYSFIFISDMHYGVYNEGSVVPVLFPSSFRGVLRIKLVDNNTAVKQQTIGFVVKGDGLYFNSSDSTDRVWVYGVR